RAPPDRIADSSAAGGTPVLVARDGQAIGIIVVADTVRESGHDGVDMLRRQGVQRVVMLTGDSRGIAQSVAQQLGVDECRAELLPEDKVAAVEDLRRKYGAGGEVGVRVTEHTG